MALGETATFTANVTYADPLGQVVYEWYRADNVRADWDPTPVATGSSYTPPALTAANADTLYYVRALFRNGYGDSILWESDSVRLVPAATASGIPKTGDGTPLALLGVLLLLSGGGLAAHATVRRRKRAE